ncbi:MAG: sensor hybrid histidine kinase [Proteobacteria bacterium]|nr:sensor hybrid histidine kinase [Pseudomonadota bacterium]
MQLASRFSSLSATALTRRFVIGWLIVVLSVVALVAYFMRASFEQQKQRTLLEVENLSMLLERDIAANLEKVDLLLRVAIDEYAGLIEKKAVDAVTVDRFLARQRDRLKPLVALRIANAAGEVILGTDGGTGSNAMIDDREYFRQLRDDPAAGLLISKPIRGRISGKWAIILARRLPDVGGRFSGIALASVGLDNFTHQFTALQMGPRGSVAMRAADLSLLARVPWDEAVAEYGSTKISQDFQRALAADPGAGVYFSGATSLDGVHRLHAYRFNSDYRFYINIGVPEDSYLAPWHHQLYGVLAMLALFLALSGGTVYLLHGYASRLGERERMLRTIFDTSDGAIFLVDPAGKIVLANERMATMWDVPLAELVGSEYVSLIHPAEREFGRERMLKLMASEIPFVRLEREYVKRDGTVFWGFLCGRRLLDEQGKFVGLVGLIADIDEPKRNARELETYRQHLEDLVRERTAQLEGAKDAAELANRAKSAFLANMSHEIRTPMNAIVGFAHLLRRDGVTPKQADRLDKIMGSAEHLLSIINDVLDISKIESGKLVLEAKPFRVVDVVERLVGLCAERAQSKGLAFRTMVGALPPVLVGDCTRLSQALLNYVGNAIKFTEAGTITLRAEVLEEDAHSLLVRFEVQDTGIGIAGDVLSRLFRPFEQADNSTTRKYGGTGLGLAITLRLAELMGGQAGVDSEAGAGSTFWLTARFGKANAAEPGGLAGQSGTVPAAGSTLRAAHILLVEDDPLNREVAAILVEEMTGAPVDLADSAEQAIAKVQATAYDLILMDLLMPGMDGLEATRRIRALPGYATTPIIALTANAFAEDRERCLAAGMNDHLGKPVVPERLQAVLEHWLAPGSLQ